MAKSSVPRHSKSARKPVTIELEASSVAKPAPASKIIPEPEPVGFEPPINVTRKPSSTDSADVGSSSSGQSTMAGSPSESKRFERKESPGDSKPDMAVPASPVEKAKDPFGRLVSGLVGGVVALIGAAALQWTGLLPSPGTDVSALEQQIAELRNVPTAAHGLDEAAQVALDGAVENAKQAVGQVTDLSTEISSIKQAIADVQKNAVSGTEGAVDTTAIDARIAELETQLKASAQAEQNAEGAATERLNALEARINDNSGNANMALAMAATGLKAAIDRGSSFTAELDTYVAVAPVPGDVASLRAAAEKGVPTISTLADQFGAVAAKIIATTRTVDPNAGVLDRLWASAEGLVEARPVGLVEGEGVDAVTARIEAHLKAGELGAAILEWEKLPDSAKAVSADFANAMKTRQKAGEIVSKALSDALAGVKSPTSAN